MFCSTYQVPASLHTDASYHVIRHGSLHEQVPETTLVVSCVAGNPAHFSEGLRFAKCNSTTKTPLVATEETFDLG
ncbi:hypothetical protein P5673_024716 [Acropora cervicornis]|uniref:Uncharacterized protein n=1 Tax=Acropora cervicornis TaxID=6130 RepID=A0AAD9Q3E5_ACRCE|nr:hypothetical protein P5673_024716 [Acropora cervicornis]